MAWIEPVYDRTQEDINLRNEKAYLNYNDLNRIINNVKEVYEKFYSLFDFYPKDFEKFDTTYNKKRFVYVNEINKIIRNINMFTKYCDVDSSFVQMQEFEGGEKGTNPNYIDYNNIEKNIEFLYNNIDNDLYIAEGEIVATGFDGGDGSITNPYQVRTPAQLAYMKTFTENNETSGVYFVQTGNIHLKGKYNWYKYSIGTYSKQFKGCYNGNGKAIIELSFDTVEGVVPVSSGIYGLFGWIGAVDGTTPIQNIELENVSYHSNSSYFNKNVMPSSFGFICGSLYGTDINVINCKVNSIKNTSYKIFANEFGGLIGRLSGFNNSYIKRCNSIVSSYNSSNDSGFFHYCGGLVGEALSGKFQECYSEGKISVFVKSNYIINNYDLENIGGLIGYSYGIEIEDCRSTVEIDSQTGCVGGIIGMANQENIIKRTYCAAKLYLSLWEKQLSHYYTSCGGIVGGFHGYGSLDLEECYFNGTINSEGGYYNEDNSIYDKAVIKDSGGIIGKVTLSDYSATIKINIKNSYSRTGFRLSSGTSNIIEKNVAGIIGIVEDLSQITVNINKCYSSSSSNVPSNISSVQKIFGIISNGQSSYITVSDAYYETGDTVDSINSYYGVSKTGSQMKEEATYSGWDFINIWSIQNGINNGYPYLKNIK